MRAILIAFILLINSCSSQMANIDRGLGHQEGYVLLNYSCPEVIKWFHFLESGKESSRWTDYSPSKQMMCGDAFGTDRDGVKLVRMKAGKYYLGTMAYAQVPYREEEKDAYQFHVYPGIVTYIGYLKIVYFGRTDNTDLIDYGFSDNFKKDKESILEFYPNLENQFEIKSKIAKKM